MGNEFKENTSRSLCRVRVPWCVGLAIAALLSMTVPRPMLLGQTLAPPRQPTPPTPSLPDLRPPERSIQPKPATPPPLPTPVAAEGEAKSASPTAMAPPLPSPEKLSEQVTRMLRDLAPREYENRKKWGLTKKVVSGVDIDRDGLKLKTHRRWKTVNDGLWKRYKATIVDPERDLDFQVVELAEAGPGRIHMDIVLLANLDLEGRVVKYQRNVRLLSLTAVANALVKLELSLELGASLDPTKLPPDVVLDVVVKDAKLRLLEFQLRRLSDVKGAGARGLGKLVEEIAEDELKDQREKLVEKLNKKIDKKRDSLRFSLSDLLPSALRGKSKDQASNDAKSDPKGEAVNGSNAKRQAKQPRTAQR